MATIQLSFSLRVSSGVKSVHLLGSWDNYVGQIPLSKDKSSSKSGSWKGTFRFQGNLAPGQRYWYYYIIDGYHVSHNPSEASTVEPTTGRELNILDVPKDKSSKSSKSSHSASKSSSRHHSSSSRDKHRYSTRGSLSLDIPKGRPLSMSKIVAPKPVSPHATRNILDANYYDDEQIEELTARFGSADIDDDEYITTDFSTSPVSSSGSSLSYRSDSSSPSSLSGYSTPSSDYGSCTCERYGITRKGDRVKIDCGGTRCGYSDEDSACSSSGDEEEYVPRSSRRNGIVVSS
ncbi:GTP-binding protein EsdC [Xylaria palmicola]|nr:GTP-binding protein EsdC [Xylaria palmicola]